MSDRIYPDPQNEARDLRKAVIFLTLLVVEIAIVVILIIMNAQAIAQTLPFSAEKEFIRPYEDIAVYFQDEENSNDNVEKIEAYLNELANGISRQMQLPEDYTLEVHYLHNDMENAFAMLGGHIFVTQGLLHALESENSLSFVLSHEIAHIKQRDPLAGLGRGLALQMIINFVAGQSGGGANVALSGGELSLLHFSREQEVAADNTALATVRSLYGHIGDAGALFQHLLQEHGEDSESAQGSEANSRLENWLSSHPLLQQRLESIAQAAKTNNWYANGETTPLPAWLKEAVRPALNPGASAGS